MGPKKRSRKTRRSSEEEEKKPEELGARSDVEEEKQETSDVLFSSPGGRDDLDATMRWDDIGEEEEMYLANTREELYELIMKKDTFKCKIKERNFEELRRLARSLFTYSRENIDELQLLQVEEDGRDSPNERTELGKFTALISFQARRIGWMTDEFARRLRQAVVSLKKKEKLIEELNGENSTLRENLEVVIEERDELHDRLDSRSAARKDASVSTEAEMPQVEMAADLVLPPSGEVSRRTREILEAIVEDKVGDILARSGLPLYGKSTGQDGFENRAVQTPKVVDTWSEVVKRRKRKPPASGKLTSHMQKKAPVNRGSPPPVEMTTGEKRESLRTRRGGRRKRKVWPAPPRTAAVVLSAPVGKEAACVELLRRAKEELPSIDEMGIPSLRVRRARTGGLILGVPGEHPQAGADCLAASLSGLASKLGVRVTRPTRKADIRVSGLEESTTETEVVTAISSLTGCSRDGIKFGRIRWSPAGLGALWIQCPIETAIKAAKEGSIKVGWVHASVEMLGTRPLRCYKCLEVGHVAIQCTSEVDRARRCYRCGSEGHTALSCGERVTRCPLCADKGRPHQHMLGGTGCCNDIPPLTRRSSSGRGVEKVAQDGRAASFAAG